MGLIWELRPSHYHILVHTSPSDSQNVCLGVNGQETWLPVAWARQLADALNEAADKLDPQG